MPRIKFVPLTPFAPTTMPEATVLCLGNFDGVHLAHRALMEKTKAVRDTELPNAVPGVFCFHGLSSDFLQSTPTPHLCTQEDRLSLFREMGMEFAILADFPALKDLPAADFVSSLLIGECHCIATVCGFNYRFGKGGVGTPELLRAHLGARAYVEPPVTLDGAPVSSTRIRSLLQAGDLEAASRLLCRPYGFSAPVLHGKRLGRTIGIPTVNQAFPKGQLILPRGVYVTECTVDGVGYRGVTNVGVHPTVDEGAPVNCETFLLDFSGEIYGKTVTVSFLHYLRPERRFDSLEELRLQIQADVEQARTFDTP